MTWHAGGVITMNIEEADDPTRERVREQMGEPYRTLVGHFRHETGHYYWDTIVARTDWLGGFRQCFGDETMDYAEALKRNYEQGPPADWQEHFISTYASTHPWEDFAECFAHYVHIVDTLEMARALGLVVDPRGHAELSSEVDFNPYRAHDAAQLVEAWIPFSVAMNGIHRSMGVPDLYPFILTPTVVAKLEFIHGLVHGNH